MQRKMSGIGRQRPLNPQPAASLLLAVARAALPAFIEAAVLLRPSPVVAEIVALMEVELQVKDSVILVLLA